MLENAMRFYNETMPFKQGVRSSNLRWSTKKKPVSSMLTGFSALLQVYATIHIFTRKTERFFKLNDCSQAIFQAKFTPHSAARAECQNRRRSP